MNELIMLCQLRAALHFINLAKLGCGLTEQQHYDINEAIKRIQYVIDNLED